MWKKWIEKINNKDKTDFSYDNLDPAKIPSHVAIIMDGNGRWAQKRGLPRALGHQSGVNSLRKIVKTASQIGVKVLTCYAFSTENWKRPSEEVALLMNLFSTYIDSELTELNQNNVKIMFSGNIEELNKQLLQKFINAQKSTENNTGLILNMAVNYGSRAEITRAVRDIAEKVAIGIISLEEIDMNIIDQHLYTAGLPDPDLLIRPSGDLRISNFLLWQCAYTELWFTDINWPDFDSNCFIQSVKDYQNRERRFGGFKKSK